MMGMHTEDLVVAVGGSVVAGAVSATLARLSLLLVVVPLSVRLEYSPGDPISVAATSTTREPGS